MFVLRDVGEIKYQNNVLYFTLIISPLKNDPFHALSLPNVLF